MRGEDEETWRKGNLEENLERERREVGENEKRGREKRERMEMSAKGNKHGERRANKYVRKEGRDEGDKHRLAEIEKSRKDIISIIKEARA